MISSKHVIKFEYFYFHTWAEYYFGWTYSVDIECFEYLFDNLLKYQLFAIEIIFWKRQMLKNNFRHRIKIKPGYLKFSKIIEKLKFHFSSCFIMKLIFQ